MTITFENEVAEDLIKFKLKSTKLTLKNILDSWNEDNAEDFIEKVKSGVLLNGEMDAITVRQLIKDIDKLQSLLQSIL